VNLQGHDSQNDKLKGHKLKTNDDITNSVVEVDTINKPIEDHLPIKFDKNSINGLNIEDRMEKKLRKIQTVFQKVIY